MLERNEIMNASVIYVRMLDNCSIQMSKQYHYRFNVDKLYTYIIL